MSGNFGKLWDKLQEKIFIFCRKKIRMPETYQRGYIDKYITRKYNAQIKFLINNKGNEKGNFFQVSPDFCIWEKETLLICILKEG